MTRARHNSRTDTLEQLIRRVRGDARAVNAPMSPELLAQAIRAARWTHPTASDRRLTLLIAERWTGSPREIAAALGEHGWTHQYANVTTRAD